VKILGNQNLLASHFNDQAFIRGECQSGGEEETVNYQLFNNGIYSNALSLEFPPYLNV
jgi:hypothetical protein